MPKPYQDIPLDGCPSIQAKYTEADKEFEARFNDGERGRYYNDDFGPQYEQEAKRYIWRRMARHRQDITKRHRKDQGHPGAMTQHGDDIDTDREPYNPYDPDNSENNLIEAIDFKRKIERAIKRVK